jgi:hypothetical protein
LFIIVGRLQAQFVYCGFRSSAFDVCYWLRETGCFERTLKYIRVKKSKKHYYSWAFVAIENDDTRVFRSFRKIFSKDTVNGSAKVNKTKEGSKVQS